MSFADSLRTELAAVAVKHPCCRRALTAGLLINAVPGPGKTLTVRYRNEMASPVAVEAIRLQYAKLPDVVRTGACGHYYWDLSFSAPAAHKMLSQLRAAEANAEDVLRFSCDGCRSAFLRGVFLAAGTVNDPHKSFHLEYLLNDETGAEVLGRFVESIGFVCRRVKRANGVGIYFKDGEAVSDLITLMGSNHVIFDFINSRIERDIRNNENRATNCVAKNIEKTISAAARQMEAIGRLMESGRLEGLSEGLKTTALVRYRNPDATLDELAAMHEPAISRSGLNHRLAKLLEEADL